jgi:hypothetical protein
MLAVEEVKACTCTPAHGICSAVIDVRVSLCQHPPSHTHISPIICKTSDVDVARFDLNSFKAYFGKLWYVETALCFHQRANIIPYGDENVRPVEETVVAPPLVIEIGRARKKRFLSINEVREL